MSREKFDEIKKLVTNAKKNKLQTKLLERKVISMTKISDLINRIDELNPNKEKVDEKNYEIYKSINEDLNDLINTILSTKMTIPRKKCLTLCV